jgi:hypothetical protein
MPRLRINGRHRRSLLSLSTMLQQKKSFFSLARKLISPDVLRRLRRKFYVLQKSQKHQPKFSWQQIGLSYLGSFIGIAILAYLSVYSS